MERECYEEWSRESCEEDHIKIPEE